MPELISTTGVISIAFILFVAYIIYNTWKTSRNIKLEEVLDIIIQIGENKYGVTEYQKVRFTALTKTPTPHKDQHNKIDYYMLPVTKYTGGGGNPTINSVLFPDEDYVFICMKPKITTTPTGEVIRDFDSENFQNCSGTEPYNEYYELLGMFETDIIKRKYVEYEVVEGWITDPYGITITQFGVLHKYIDKKTRDVMIENIELRKITEKQSNRLTRKTYELSNAEKEIKKLIEDRKPVESSPPPNIQDIIRQKLDANQ